MAQDLMMDFADYNAAKTFLVAEGWAIDDADGFRAADRWVSLIMCGVIQVAVEWDQDGLPTRYVNGGDGRYAVVIRFTGERAARFDLAALQKELEGDPAAPGNGKRLRREADQLRLKREGDKIEKIQPERDQIDGVSSVPVTQRAVKAEIAAAHNTGDKTVPVRDDAARSAATLEMVEQPKHRFL